jgi:hypothetical protein
MTGLHPRHYVLMAATLVVGLVLDVHTDFFGQLAIGGIVWGILFYLLGQVDRHERRILFGCLAIATIGEIILSLGWGLYTYRLDNIPHFVPPGHVLMLMLGIGLARHVTPKFALGVIGAAMLYAVAAAISGFDTFAAALALVLLAVSLVLPAHRPLYASTFVLALALELYGTWLGNWTWSAGVPAIGLTTTNPPALAGAFYATLDALVLATMVLLVRRDRDARAGQAVFAATAVSSRF